MSPSRPAFAAPAAVPTRSASASRSCSPRRAPRPHPRPARHTPRATVAVPSDAPHTAPGSDDAASAPWMPLPGLVHTVTTPEEFDRLLEVATAENALLVADFMASWCRKCLYLLPRLKKLASEYDRVYYCKIDVNKVRRLPKQFAIQKMPTFVFLRGGETVATIVGGAAPPKVAETLRAAIEKRANV